MIARVSAAHLERRACVYVRQSTTNQVLHHAESTRRQYALVERAVALGWSKQSIDVIDEDQGCSGSTSDRRGGFQRLVEAVAHAQVGAVLALEVSRLARSSPDWQRLLSLCAVAETLVVDEQAIYDTSAHDDKLLLDIKGTMSEAELHWLSLRMVGAVRSKARRGELRLPVPTGYVWREEGLAFDPDESVQRAIKLVFERYTVEPSVLAVVRWANANGILIPTRKQYKDGTSSLVWNQLVAQRVLEMLKNPIYAGVYVYGRRPKRKRLLEGEIKTVRDTGRDPDKWAVRIDNAHAGYITWEQYVKNNEKLRGYRVHQPGRSRPYGGPALLNGLLVCGRCGLRMTALYSKCDKHSYAYYRCRGEHGYGAKQCWTVMSGNIDRAVEDLFLRSVAPAELDLSLAVESQVAAQAATLDKHWKLRIEQARYEARRAERRYKAVDPDNRVVARTLEREWEEQLQQLDELESQRDRARREHAVQLTTEDRKAIRALARDLPKVWRSKTTEQSERKAMLGLVIEAITLNPVDVPRRATRVQVAWKGGAVTELTVERPEHGRVTPDCATKLIRKLAANGMHDAEIAKHLNTEGLVTGAQRPWTKVAVYRARCRANIASIARRAGHEPAPDRDSRGRFSIVGAARHFGVSCCVVRGWVKGGRVEASLESHGPHHDVYWLTIDQAAERDLREHLRRTAHRYPRTVPPPRRARDAQAPTTEKIVS